MNNEIKTISPFRNFCITIGALPTSYLESMSYYEMLCWLCKYLENTVNPAINQNAEALKELQDYVANYFDNLDVTEEINNKLDEMAESGALAEIINVEMIGTLSNLNTTDKTNVVNAINEVNTNVNKLNLTNFVWYDKDDMLCDNGTIRDANLCVATSSDGSVGKIYGYIWNTPEDGITEIHIRIPSTNISADSEFEINYAGYGFDLPNNQVLILGYTIKTNGDVYINIPLHGTNETLNVLNPYLFFFKNFGD